MPDRPAPLSALCTPNKARTPHLHGSFGVPVIEPVRTHARRTAHDDGSSGLDETEMLEDVAAWMSAPARRAFVGAVGMTGETARRFVEDPDTVLREARDGSDDEDAPTWAEVFDHELTAAWHRYAAERAAPERRRLGIHYAWGGRRQEG